MRPHREPGTAPSPEWFCKRAPTTAQHPTKTTRQLRRRSAMADNERWRNNQDYADREYDRSRGRYAGGREDRSGGREGYRGGGRDFGDRASDEVRSWFGDDEAQRQRREDERRGGYERDYGS